MVKLYEVDTSGNVVFVSLECYYQVVGMEETPERLFSYLKDVIEYLVNHEMGITTAKKFPKKIGFIGGTANSILRKKTRYQRLIEKDYYITLN